MRAVIFTFLGVLWFSLGMGFIIAQAWFIEILERLLADEVRLFVLVQLQMILSLALVIGTTGFAFRVLWIVVGILGLAQGVFLISAPIGRREAFLDWWFKRPFWEYRLCGLVLVGLATALAYAIVLL